MRNKTQIKIIVATVLLSVIFGCNFFKSSENRIKKLLEGKPEITIANNTEMLIAPELTANYYSHFNSEKPQSKAEKYRAMLREMLSYADSLGLDSAAYHHKYFLKYDSLQTQNDYEAETEIIFTDAVLAFLYHTAYGNDLKQIQFNGVSFQIDSAKILRAFNNLLTDYDWQKTLDSIEPKFPQYVVLKNALCGMNNFLKRYPETDSSFGKTPERKSIILKLKAYQLLSDTLNNDSVSEILFTDALKKFQAMMNLDATGKTDNQTLTALAFPIEKRIRQIKESINCWRWINRLSDSEFFLVNIPSAQLQLVSSDTTADMNMKVIVGKTTTRTPSFASYITKVIAYPYWTVPRSIATKEMLPKIKRSVAYLEENNLQVINSKGEIIAPEKIEWQNLSANNFPYTIRQSTGCDNSLGVLKFDLNNPFSIYLHDTNAKSLFGNKSRFLSHGCIRVEKPMEIAGFLLREGLDSITINLLNSCVREQKPRDFLLKKKFAVFVLYMTAEVDKNGGLKFYNDVYKRE